MIGTTDKLSKFRRSPLPETNVASMEKKPAQKTELYQAFRLCDMQQYYLEILRKHPAPALAIGSSMITEIEAEIRHGQMITLICGASKVIAIDGENLAGLFHPLKNWNVASLQQFDPKFHHLPQDDTLPVIREIQIITQRPEPAPPVNQRH